MTIITLLSAFFISSIAAWFSVAGLVAVFPGSPIAISLMGAALELGKLVAASWIYRFWDSANKLMRVYFVTAIIVLSFITSIGIFGYLTKSYAEGTQDLGNNSEQIVLLDNQIEQEQLIVDDARKTIQQMDVAIASLSNTERSAERAIRLRATQRNERVSLNETIRTGNKKVSELRAEKAKLNAGQRTLETEVGPIKYVAQLVYSSDDATTIDKAVRLLTLMLIFVFDPLAILLVIAANMTAKMNREENKKVKIEPTKNFVESIKNNVTEMNDDWNPGSWFKMVKKPKTPPGTMS